MVVPGELYDVTETEWQDIVEESAYLSEDFGGYTVERWYELAQYIGPDAEARLEYCAQDARCYADELFDTGLDYVLVVHVIHEADEFIVSYQTIDLAISRQVADQAAYLPDALAFEFLVAPCHEALKVTPEWTAPPAPLVVVAPPLPPIVVVPPPERRRAQLGRIGTVAAGSGAALLTGGVLLSFAADETQQTIQSEPHERQELESLQTRGRRQVRLGNTLMAIGGVALIGGGTLLVVDHLGRNDDASVSLSMTPSRVAIGARF